MPRAGVRGGDPKKPASSFEVKEADNVVFGSAKLAKKTKRPDSNDVSAKSETKSTSGAEEGALKKVDTRTLIGGASWTGKLPVNMLSEHCQKQKWAKPEYTMNKNPEGFSSMVILKAFNEKSWETVTLPPLKLPPEVKHIALQPTAVEARHFAAAYALFRVCSMRNIHMMMPPAYRDLWKKDFQDLKNKDLKNGNAWMYEADPFATKQEREEAQTLMAKRRDARELQKAREAAQPFHSLSAVSSNASQANSYKLKGWINAPKAEMGKRTRAHVESLVRRKVVWNSYGFEMSEFERHSIVDEYGGLGFRKSHIEEAVNECKDREEALEWLLIHVPEDDLPAWSLPEGYTAGVSMASGNLKRDASIRRLAEAGYSTELCAKILDDNDGKESNAAQVLQDALIDTSSNDSDSNSTVISALRLTDSDQQNPIWIEEQEVLASIFAERFTRVDPDMCHIRLEVLESKAPTIAIRRSKLYPWRPPLISVLAPSIPAYIRLSITRQLIHHVNTNILGESMVFNMVDWLEAEIPRIMDSPGKLRDVSAAASGLREPTGILCPSHRKRRNRPFPIDWSSGRSQSTDMLSQWTLRQTTPQQQRMLASRRLLPAWKVRDEIVKAVSDHQVTIISGETGSGKSTQSVQFILDDMIQRQLGACANIICTQPRRISALGLADRVSDERCSIVGDEVGYAIRGESKQKAGITRLTFVTTGVLLRRLQTSGGSREDVVAALADVSHVVVDEVHERSLDTDFLLVLLRDIVAMRKDLKVILMSATLNATVFENYFNTTSTVAKVEIQGRTFPVEDCYLDDVIRLTGFSTISKDTTMDGDYTECDDPSIGDTIQSVGMRINYDLIASTARAIDSQLGPREGSILIFLPGTSEITRTLDAIRRIPNVHALPLHASLMPSEQRRVFPPAPPGQRKVIAATNVAETSITIEDIVAVIDCGRVKETSFDPQTKMVKLEEVWASKAACKQRRGRAGRVRDGVCYKLYTRNAEAKMAERPEPEIRRVPLEQLCLSVRAMGIADVPAFLANALTPPETLAVHGAVELLVRMGALDGDELTALGRHLSMIPADLRCGKLMVYGAIFGCLEACLTIAAILTVKSPFVSPQTKREESKAARLPFAHGQGDLVCDLRAYQEWSERKQTCPYRELKLWCDQNFLSPQTLNDITLNRTQYLSSLKEVGFLPTSYHSETTTSTSLNAHNSNHALIRALIAGAFSPQIARIEFPTKKFAPSVSGAVELDPEARSIKYFTQGSGDNNNSNNTNDERVFVHPSSTLFGAQSFPGNSVYISYFTKMATSKVFIRDVTPFNVYALLLFSSGPLVLDTLGRGIVVDGWLKVRGWARIGVLVGRLRVLLDAVLARKLDEPGWDLGMDGDGNEVVGAVRAVVEFGGLDC